MLKKYPMPFIQVSARTGDNISNLFPTAIEETIRVSRNATEENEKTHKTETNEYAVTEKAVRLPERLPTATFDSHKIVLGGEKEKVDENRQSKCC